MSTIRERLELELWRHDEELGVRNNQPRNYLPQVIPYLRCVHEHQFKNVPAPLCVQLQVSSRCTTDCKMCDHWRLADKENELTLKEWEVVFTDLGGLKVRTVIFSGGEPLVRDDIAELLGAAKKGGLHVGLLTNGQMNKRQAESKKVIAAVRENVDWVAVSIDGTETVDRTIRNPHAPERENGMRERSKILKDFCAGITDKNPSLKVSATVTLQRDNIHMNLHEAFRFIKGLGIPQVNFKLATGAGRALDRDRKPDYLLSASELDSFLHFLWNNHLPQDKGNNLAYLRRTFAANIFGKQETSDGEPLRSFYGREKLRCYTPFLFSLIDYNGDVFTCCHLYRDNHGSHVASRKYRDLHRMGSLREVGFDFNKIWNGDKYAAERELLTKVNPETPDFFPCGECTRHCQHNSVLTRVEMLHNEAPAEVEKALEELGGNYDPVWF